MKHALNRTSPKGKGMPFFGTCYQCGEQNLPGNAIFDDCPNIIGATNSGSMLHAIDPDEFPDPSRDDGGQVNK